MDTTLTKSELKALILRFAKGTEKKFHITWRLDNSISDEGNPTSIAKKLFDAIEEGKSHIKSINRITDLDTQLSKEIDLFTSEDGRVEYLRAAYSYLGTILPTSVDCETCISAAPYVDYKNSFRWHVRCFNLFKKLFKTIIYLFWIANNFLKTNIFVDV